MPIVIDGTNGVTFPDSTILASGSITPAKLSTGAPSWDSSGNVSFNSGYGSVATAYGCRAWVNFNGTGTVAIRASGNVTSITDNGVGDYTVNFTTAMPDANYSVHVTGQRNETNANQVFGQLKQGTSPSTSTGSVRVIFEATANDAQDPLVCAVSVFR